MDGPLPDVIVIGAGAIGAATAYALVRRGVKVLVLEKEESPGRHQSSRNSGVIHAGYNLKPGSLKAKYSVEGNRRLKEFCREHGIPLLEGGILIVARTEAERATIAELKRRADANGVASAIHDEAGIRAVEPHASGIEALHAPEGASFDGGAYVEKLMELVEEGGGEIRYGCRVRGGVADCRVQSVERRSAATALVATSQGRFEAPVVVNAAGLHADRLAGPVSADLRVIPFRGYYAELVPERCHLARSHIYAAPDLSFPFLGVHISRQADGRVLVGPGAMLAFGREAYALHHVHPVDLSATLAWPGFWGLFGEPKFRRLVRSEVAKSLRLRAIWREARLLIPELQPGDLVRSFAGNRAQLVRRDGTLVDDILVREAERAVHVLNAVSPGLTASLPFGEELAQRVMAKLG
jgi:L-2-hydroxyglutarate oxidase